MNLEQLANLINEYFEVGDFFDIPQGKRPPRKIKARRMYFLFASEFLCYSAHELAERHHRVHYNIWSDIRLIKNEIEVNVISERQFNELKDAFDALKEPFNKSVEYEKGKTDGIKTAIHQLNKLL